MTEEARTAQRPLASYLTKNYEFTTQEDAMKAMDIGRQLFEAGLREAARIVRERKDKHVNLLSKNVLEIAASAILSRLRELEPPEIAGQANEGGV